MDDDRWIPERLNRPGTIVVLVTGGRQFSDEHLLMDLLDRIEQASVSHQLRMMIVQGGAQGADRIAREWAWHNNVQLFTERAQWERDGKAAGVLRNQRMLDLHRPDICIAMPGGRGTADMVRRCRLAGVPVIEPPAQEEGR